MKKCKCGEPVETKIGGFEYELCKNCWWNEDPRNKSVVTARKNFQESFDMLVGAIKADDVYYQAWYTSLKNCFIEAYHRNHKNHGVNHIASIAANDFLQSLIDRLDDKND